MSVEGSHPIVLHVVWSPQKGVSSKKGISSACNCLRPLATVSSPTSPIPILSFSWYHNVLEFGYSKFFHLVGTSDH